MLSNKLTSLLAAVVLLLSPTPANAADFRPQIEPFANQLLASKLVTGFVVGIYVDGETQVIGYGETEPGSGVAPDGDTVYEIGSASKLFTGVLLADLVERGRVKLGDPIQTYLSEPAKSQLTNPSGITFEHLATHTSGLPKIPDNMPMADLENPYADYTPKLLFAYMKDYKPGRAPGEYAYSNLGMGLLGELLAGREKMSFEELLIKRVVKPCGMSDTSITLSDAQRQRLAPPYGANLRPTKNWDFPTLAGCGGIRSTTNDLLKFIAANFANDDKPITRAFRLAREERHKMSHGQMGLAWHIYPDGATYWHNGRTGGYSSWVAVAPGRKAGVVVLCNTSTDQIDLLGTQLTLAFLAEIAEDSKLAPFSGVRWEGEKPVVKINDDWFTLVSLDGVAAEQIVAFCQKTYDDKWQKRFAEDLVEVFTGMGHAPKATVELVVQPQGSSEQQTLQAVPMTAANRQAIRDAAQDEPNSPEVQVAPEVLKKYEGVYAFTPQFAIKVTREGTKLVVQATGQPKLQLEAESATEFRCQEVDAQITFAGDDNGKAKLLILHQNGANQVGTRHD